MKIHNLDKPIQYTNGWVEFYKLKFKVTPDVLIPRPETELLVDEILHSELITHNSSTTIFDIGTGSGNIAIALAKNLPNVRIFATDVSKEALEVAKENTKLVGVENQITFIQCDLLKYDRLVYHTKNNMYIIVANLPYIPSERIPYLDPSVKDFEPKIALDGGPDGFELYRKLFQQIKEKFLNQLSYDRSTFEIPLKLIVCEIDYTHGDLAVTEAQKNFPKANIEVKTDLAKKQRILVIQSLN